MPYLDESGLKTLSRNIVNAIKENTKEKETIFSNEYCVEACRNYLNSTYTADTFPLRYHINKGNEIWIDGISEAGLSDNNFSKENITINSKYTIDGTEYTVTGIGDYSFALAQSYTGAEVKSEQEEDALFACRTITLPSTVTHLGDKCFGDGLSTKTSKYRTKRLLQHINGTDNVSDITGTNTFSSCSNLVTLYLPKVNAIVKNMCSSCTSLTQICLGDIKTVPDEAFRQCFRLERIAKADGTQFNIESFGYQSVCRCLGLKEFNFNVDAVKSVDEEAFLYCSYNTDWQKMIDNGCKFGLRATKYQRWKNPDILTHNFNITPCLNTNGKNYSLQQSYNGWRNITQGNSTDIYFGAQGCSWMAATMAYNILSGQDLTPVQFNNLVANSKDSQKANSQLSHYDGTSTIANLTCHPKQSFTSIESIQGIYDGLAAGKIYDCYIVSGYEKGTNKVSGAHAHLIVGIDEEGKLIMCESNYGGPNHNTPTSGLIHIDLFNWFTDIVADNYIETEWVYEITYDPEYEV